MKFERTNDSSPFTSYTIKLVDNSTHLTKTLDISDNFREDFAKVYDRKNLIFMQYGNQWLIHKFGITKTYFEKIVKDKRTYTSFNRFIYNEVLYKSWMVLPTFFFRGSLRDTSRYQIQTTFNTINFIPKYYGASNIFITPDLYSNAKKTFVRNFLYVGYINVQDNLLQTFRQILIDNEINIYRL